MPFLSPASHTTQPADEAVNFDKTLAVAATAEVLFSVPTGKFLRGLALLNEGPGDARISVVAGAAPDATSIMLKPGESTGLDGLELAEGDYEFVNVTAGKKPRVRGTAQVGP